MSSIFNKKNIIVILFSAFFLTSCGTQFTCSPEIGAPPERAFWCSPVSKIGSFFSLQKNYKSNQTSTSKEKNNKNLCEKTIGDKECNKVE